MKNKKGVPGIRSPVQVAMIARYGRTVTTEAPGPRRPGDARHDPIEGWEEEKEEGGGRCSTVSSSCHSDQET